MPVSLAKRQPVSLTELAPGLRTVHVGLGWDMREDSDEDADLDASVFMVTAAGTVLSDDHFVFYNALRSPCGSVSHSGDNRTGAGDGDDEAIVVDLLRVPAAVQKLVFAVSVHDTDEKAYTFGLVRSAFMRIINRANGEELARFDLSTEAAQDTAIIFGEVYRRGAGWDFEGLGDSSRGGLLGLVKHFGVTLK